MGFVGEFGLSFVRVQSEERCIMEDTLKCSSIKQSCIVCKVLYTGMYSILVYLCDKSRAHSRGKITPLCVHFTISTSFHTASRAASTFLFVTELWKCYQKGQEVCFRFLLRGDIFFKVPITVSSNSRYIGTFD